MTTSTNAQLSTQASTDALSAAYDSVLYESLPFSVSHPSCTGAIALLFGLKPADVATARILDIGCASGGNILSIAATYPGCQVVGLELSPVQAKLGQEMVARCGLSNAKIIEGDVLNMPDLGMEFDYIISHGVYSWVPEAVQTAILAQCRKLLSPHGVAYISYNVYPGWKSREVLRDLMMLHTGPIAEPKQRIEQARAILNFASTNSDAKTPYGALLRQESAALAQSPDHYLFHEHLARENRPCYFKEFAAAAKAQQLGYLGDSIFQSMLPQTLGDVAAAKLMELSGGDLIYLEQYMDFLTNRTFRTSLLVREELLPELNRNLGDAELELIYLEPTLHFTKAPSYTQAANLAAVRGSVEYAVRGDQRLTISDPNVNTLIDTLLQAGPNLMSFPQAAAIAGKRLGMTGDAASIRKQFFGNLLYLLFNNAIQMHLAKPPLAQTTGKLTGLSHAVALASMDNRWVVNKQHAAVSLSVIDKHMLALMDGSRSHSELLAELMTRIQSGVIKVGFKGIAANDDAGMAKALDTQLKDFLVRADYLGLLVTS
jgi:methyltransferase-like protein